MYQFHNKILDLSFCSQLKVIQCCVVHVTICGKDECAHCHFSGQQDKNYEEDDVSLTDRHKYKSCEVKQNPTYLMVAQEGNRRL